MIHLISMDSMSRRKPNCYFELVLWLDGWAAQTRPRVVRKQRRISSLGVLRSSRGLGIRKKQQKPVLISRSVIGEKAHTMRRVFIWPMHWRFWGVKFLI